MFVLCTVSALTLTRQLVSLPTNVVGSLSGTKVDITAQTSKRAMTENKFCILKIKSLSPLTATGTLYNIEIP